MINFSEDLLAIINSYLSDLRGKTVALMEKVKREYFGQVVYLRNARQ